MINDLLPVSDFPMIAALNLAGIQPTKILRDPRGRVLFCFERTSAGKVLSAVDSGEMMVSVMDRLVAMESGIGSFPSGAGSCSTRRIWCPGCIAGGYRRRVLPGRGKTDTMVTHGHLPA